MLIAGYYSDAEDIFQIVIPNERIKLFIEYADGFRSDKSEPSIRGPCALGYDFYIQGGSFFLNSHFLFGIASQFRI